jgi:glycosyltransferase involved in cell wall biosynthesis
MKILFYNHTGQVSGAERVMLMILGGVDRELYESVVVCPPASNMMELADAAGVRTCGLAQLEARFTWRPDRVAKYLWSFLGVMWRARRTVKEELPDLIHANSIRAGLVMSIASVGLGVPVVWHAHDILPFHPISTLVRLVALLTSNNHVLAVSQAVASAFRGILLRPFKRRVPITVIHNAVDLNRFKPDGARRDEMRRALNLSDDQPTLGIVGQLTPRKGQRELIQAFATVVRTLPNAVLLIVGEPLFNRDDEYARQLNQLVDSLALTNRVRFLGPRNDVPQLLQALDVLAVNSHQEPFALTVLEGLASGVAVVGTAVGGTPEMIRHGVNGWLVKPRANDELAAGLISLLGNPDLRMRLGSQGRQDALSRYSIPRFIAQLDALYRENGAIGRLPRKNNLKTFKVNLGAD